MTPFVLSVIFGLIAALANSFGGMAIVSFKKKWTEAFLSIVVALSAGFMLSASILRMLPESLALSSKAPLFMLIGYLAVYFFESLFSAHFHLGEKAHQGRKFDPTVGISAFIGLCLHAFFDGVSIASGFFITQKLGFLIFLATILHKIPEGAMLASIMLTSGLNKRLAFGSTLMLGFSTILGALLTSIVSNMVGLALAISTGIIIYVAASDLIPKVNEERELKNSTAIVSGVVMFYLIEKILEKVGI